MRTDEMLKVQGIHDDLMAEIERLRAALKYAVVNIQGIMDGTDIPSVVILQKCYAALEQKEPNVPWPLHHENTCKSLITHDQNDCDCDQRPR